MAASSGTDGGRQIVSSSGSISAGLVASSAASSSEPPVLSADDSAPSSGGGNNISRSYETWPRAWREELFELLKKYHPGNRGSIAWDAIISGMKESDPNFNRSREKLMEFRKNSLATLREVLRKMGVGESGGEGGFEFKEEWQKLAYEV